MSGIALGKFNGNILPENYEPNSSSIIPLDFDKLALDELVRLKAVLCSLPEIVFCFTSISGVGLKAGLCVGSIKNGARYKQCFNYAKEWLKSIDSSLILDDSGSDIKRLIFTSSDPEAYFNPTATTLVVPEDYVVPSIYNDKPQHLVSFKPNDATRALMGFDDSFPCNDSNKDRLRMGVGELYKANGNTLSESAWYFDVLCPLKNLVEQGWPEEEAYALFDEVCQQMDGYEAVYNEERWNKQAPPTSGNAKTYKSLLAYAPKNRLRPDIKLGNSAFSGFSSSDSEDGEAFVADKKYKVFTTDVRDGTATTRPLTELGNAGRLRDKYATNVKFVIGHSLIHWVDGCWKWDLDSSMTRRLAAELHKDIYAESLTHPQFIQQFATWSRASQTEAKIENAVSLYSDFAEVRIPFNFIDGDIFKVGLANSTQVIDLKTGLVRRAERSDYITKSLNVNEVGSAASAERWLRFLNEVFNNDQELIAWFKMWCGYLLTGSTKEQFFVFLYGFGSNGKGVLTTIINTILGDYSKTVGSETFTDTKRQAGAASPDIAKLCGARLVLSTETNEGVALSEALVKTITGEDMLSARHLRKDEFEFKPQFKMMMSGNHKPVIRGTDNGIWRRVRLLPFTKIFDESEKDVNLTPTLLREAPHILAWMIDGCLEWQKIGLSKTPKVILNATAEYRADQDILGLWIEEECEIGAQHSQANSTLYYNYKVWCEKNSNKPASNKTFSQRLSERGFDKRKSDGTMHWSGIRITPLFQDS